MMLDILAATEIQDERLSSLATLWQSAFLKIGKPPTFESLHGSIAADTEPLTWLVEERGTPRRFCYLSSGEHVRIAYGGSIVGRYLDEIVTRSALPRVHGYFDIALARPAIVYIAGRIYAEADRPADGERILLPIADARNGRVNRLLGATIHSWIAPNNPTGMVSTRQARTFIPLDGAPPWSETGL